MSSIHLPSFLHRSSSKKETSSLLSKRSTLSFRTQQEDELPSLHRSSTTISKVKRFGSLLVRNKKNDASSTIRRADSIFPPNIDTTLSASNYSLSAISTNTNASSDEDDLVTPTTSNPPHINMIKDEMEANVTVSSVEQAESVEIKPSKYVTPQDQTNHTSPEQDVTAAAYEPICPVVGEMQIDPMALSSLVQFYLSTAIDEADVEIEGELQVCRDHMLHSIRAMPTYSF